jgi:hypothetical protein
MTFHHFGFEAIRSPKLVNETIYRKQQEWMGHTMLSRWTFPLNQSCLIEEKHRKHNGFLNDISSTSIIDGNKTRETPLFLVRSSHFAAKYFRFCCAGTPASRERCHDGGGTGETESFEGAVYIHPHMLYIYILYYIHVCIYTHMYIDTHIQDNVI